MANSYKLERGFSEILRNAETTITTKNTSCLQTTANGSDNETSSCHIENCNASSLSSNLSSYCCKCSSRNIVISFITTTICCCSRNVRIWWWSLQDFENKKEISSNVATLSSSPSSTWSFGSKKNFFPVSSLKFYFFLWLFSSILVAGFFFHSCLLLALSTWKPSSDDKALFYVLAASWGACNGMWETLLLALVTLNHANHVAEVASPLQALRYMGLGITFAAHGFMCETPKIIALVIILVVSVLPYAMLEIRLESQRKTQLSNL